jgi:DNA topoisomerase I
VRVNTRRVRKLPLDPKRSAIIAGLHYMRDECSGFTRVRRGKGFSYLDCEGKPLRDAEHIARIRSLVIPPAWTKVWISPDPSGHLQAIGYDARGRKQYRYHPDYRMVRNQTKFDRLPEVAAALEAIRKKIEEHLALPGMPREKILAALIQVLDATGIRIGNPSSATENKTFGLTTLRNQHVEIEGATLRFRFTGKSGIRHELEINDRRLARIVRQCHDLPGHRLFEYLDESGEARAVSSTDVNNYLRELSGQELTAKDFRTWAGTVECAVALRDAGEAANATEGKRNIVAAIKTAAQKLGNRVATCRAYYIHPAIPEAYLSGELLVTMNGPEGQSDSARLSSGTSAGLSGEERAVLEVIRRYHGSVEVLQKTA